MRATKMSQARRLGCAFRDPGETRLDVERGSHVWRRAPRFADLSVQGKPASRRSLTDFGGRILGTVHLRLTGRCAAPQERSVWGRDLGPLTVWRWCRIGVSAIARSLVGRS